MVEYFLWIQWLKEITNVCKRIQMILGTMEGRKRMQHCWATLTYNKLCCLHMDQGPGINNNNCYEYEPLQLIM